MTVVATVAVVEEVEVVEVVVVVLLQGIVGKGRWEERGQ